MHLQVMGFAVVVVGNVVTVGGDAGGAVVVGELGMLAGIEIDCPQDVIIAAHHPVLIGIHAQFAGAVDIIHQHPGGFGFDIHRHDVIVFDIQDFAAVGMKLHRAVAVAFGVVHQFDAVAAVGVHHKNAAFVFDGDLASIRAPAGILARPEIGIGRITE